MGSTAMTMTAMTNINIDNTYQCLGCWELIVNDRGHASGCMLRLSHQAVERVRGKTIHFPGMKNICPRCGELLEDKVVRHAFCPKRLPE
jgi:hypothetical protein